MNSLAYTLEDLGLRSAAHLARTLPESSAREFGRSLGVLGYHVAAYRREIAINNIRRALGESYQGMKPENIARQAFENLGQTAVEVFRFPKLSPADIKARVDWEGRNIFEEARDGRKGAILLSAHFGDWELFGAWIAALGYEIDVVVKPQRNTRIDTFYNNLRRSAGVGVIPTQKASRQIIASLKQKRLVAILADQYAGNDGIPVEFFGRLTATHHGPAAIALKLGCPIYHGVLVRKDRGRHQAICEGPLKIERTDDEQADIHTVTQRYTQILEEYIRQHPGQWLWTHRRWKNS